MAGNCAGRLFAGFRVFHVLADARPENRGADESSDAADHVDGRGTGEINVAEVREPALRVPNPTGFDRVDHKRDDRTVDAIGRELRALRHCAGDNRCRRGAEHEIEHEAGEVEVCEIGKNLEIR
ncbi:hypothetical protein SDC9_198329 [bioreactor metagenome]|uniref:Uncharacterized protein n=1 Tax=bioreactor metagenome TaxID=1076179 RepID=A0A645IHD5_9ZZZZ